jgi:hypothetical protein
MYGVNLDLLRSGPHHPDGRSKDPHAHHRAEHLAELGIARHARWQATLSRVLALVRRNGGRQMKAHTAP